MRKFRVDDLEKVEISSITDLGEINNSNSQDNFAQLIFYKINLQAYHICVSLHNLNLAYGAEWKYQLISLPFEKMTQDFGTVTGTDELFHLSKMICCPPNEIFRTDEVLTYSYNGIVDDQEETLTFNAYFICIIISDILYRFKRDPRIERWCVEKKMHRSSIDEVFKIVFDKYDHFFLSIFTTMEDQLKVIFNGQKDDFIPSYQSLTGLSEHNLTHHYIQWVNDFYEKELLVIMQSFFGHLKYS